MIWVVVGVVVALLLLGRLRARRRATLAGLNSARPTFSVEPPGGRLSSRRREVL